MSNSVDQSKSATPADDRPRPRRLFRRLLRSLSNQLQRRDVHDVHGAIALCRALIAERGEGSGARIASEVLDAYSVLDDAARDLFFDSLAAEFSPDPFEVRRAADAYHAEPTQSNLVRLQAAVDPRRQELFRRFNMAPGGTKTLVEMRRRILGRLRERSEWRGIDADLIHLFRSWFNRGFLSLQRIDWRTSALVLERLIQYEAVHEIQGWRDLRRRLEADRRCYAFFSPALPDDPLIFIEIALTKGVPPSVQPLLHPESPVADPTGADCATFYSITSCQEGLRGVALGNFLIKQVVEDLRREFLQLRTFATLSPVPGFVEWLRGGGDLEFEGSRSAALKRVIEQLDAGKKIEPVALAPLQVELSHLAARYLLHAKKDKAPLDSVARFHLANGARLERLNWLGDTSTAGLSRSFGITVNYVYQLRDVDKNHERYARDYRIVASRDFKRLSEKHSGKESKQGAK